jgi:kinesin family protein 6/9
MVKSPVKVIVRARPTVNFASKNLRIDEDTGYVNVNIPKDQAQGHVNHQQENWSFRFDKVLTNTPQEVVFELVAKDVLNHALEGYSGTLFCYGQTGAGKTFTMSGSSLDYKYRGMIPRSISMLFQEIQSRYEQSITFRVSYLEIYNEMMFDLLSPDLSSNLAIQEDARGSIVVKGLTQKICNNEEEALGYLFEGETNRTISQHRMNAASSRSHAIFSIYLEMRSRVESTEKVIYSKINLVDLAGSERTKKTGSEGTTLIEANYINKSLSFLEQVVVALGEKQRDHIPYRQSKLTYLLKDSIGGNSKTLMVANVWPEADHLEETISTLKFASRMMKVSNEATINIHLDPQVLLKKYEREIKELKQELAMHDTLASRGRISYEPYTPEQQYQQQVVAQQFLNGESEDIDIESLRQVKELFFQFRNLYKKLHRDVKNNAFIDPKDGQKDKPAEIKETKAAGRQIGNGVGQEENKHGFGLGKASKDAKPTTLADSLIRDDTMDQGQEDDVGHEKAPVVEKKHHDENLLRQMQNLDKNQIFSQFKEKEGKEYNESVLKNICTMKEKKSDIKELSDRCQATKDNMDRLKEAIQQKQETKNQEEIQQGIIDEEEYQYIKELKELKKSFKVETEKIKELKSTILLINQNIQQCKAALLQKFEEYFQKKYLIPFHVAMEDQSPAHSDEVNSVSDDVDPDALAYISAKKKVDFINKIKKQDKMVKG